MAYAIIDTCTKDNLCVDACPVNCIHPTKDEPGYEEAAQLWVHPEECIDCGACMPECPVDAIFHESEVPEKWLEFIALNAEMAPTLPTIVHKQQPLAS